MKKRVQLMLVAGAVAAFATAARAQRNLTIPEMKVGASTTTACVVSVRVVNSGQIDTWTNNLSLYINPVSAPTCGVTGDLRQCVGHLRSGESRWFSFSVTLPRGLCKLWAFVDSSCIIAESNEKDNQRLLSIFTSPEIHD